MRPTACNQPLEVARTRKVHGLKRRLCAWLRFRGGNRGLKPDSNSQRILMSAVDLNPPRCLELCEINAHIACSLTPSHDLEAAIFDAIWASNDRFVHRRAHHQRATPPRKLERMGNADQQGRGMNKCETLHPASQWPSREFGIPRVEACVERCGKCWRPARAVAARSANA
jgi:hypothetical protein